jgi:L-iditol 2-dehydrogenase
MLAAVLRGKEDLRVERVPLEPPEPGGMIVRIDSALTCGTDLKVWRRGYHAAMLKPPCLFGHEGAGTVVDLDPGAASDTVPGLRVGDRVVVANSAPCGTCPPCRRGQQNLCDDLRFLNGTYAEYLRIPARFVRVNTRRIPGGLPFEAAAIAEPLACVLHGLSETPAGAGDSALVIGLGPIGLLWIAALRDRGVRVTGAGRRAARLGAAQTLGAEAIEADEAGRWTGPYRAGAGFDLVVEATGRVEAWTLATELVRKGGAVNLFGGPPAGTKADFDTNRLHYRQITLKSPFHHRPETFGAALDLLASGRVPAAAIITGERPLEELPDLFREMNAAQSGVKIRIRPSTGSAP